MANVLTDLRKAGSRGISVFNYPKGFRLAAEIHVLREDWNIETRPISGRKLVKYVLKGKKQTAQFEMRI